MKNKHSFLLGLMASIFIGVCLGGCGTPCEESPQGCLDELDPSGQNISYWYQHSRDREEVILGMIDDFNAANEWGITVQGEYAGNYDEIYNKVVDGIPAGDVPEIVVAYQNQAALYQTQGAIVELSPYIESAKWGFTPEENEDFFSFVALGDVLPQIDGRYGFPPQRSMEVLYYNQDWLNALGYEQTLVFEKKRSLWLLGG